LLVLSRRAGESIMIGADVVVTVLEIRPDLVRIGIKAPRDVDVHREEVWIEVQQANQSAASPSARDVESLAAGLRETPGKALPDDIDEVKSAERPEIPPLADPSREDPPRR
jgi:carbon storage regulator